MFFKPAKTPKYTRKLLIVCCLLVPQLKALAQVQLFAKEPLLAELKIEFHGSLAIAKSPGILSLYSYILNSRGDSIAVFDTLLRPSQASLLPLRTLIPAIDSSHIHPRYQWFSRKYGKLLPHDAYTWKLLITDSSGHIIDSSARTFEVNSRLPALHQGDTFRIQRPDSSPAYQMLVSVYRKAPRKTTRVWQETVSGWQWIRPADQFRKKGPYTIRVGITENGVLLGESEEFLLPLKPALSVDSTAISNRKKWWKDWFRKKTPALPGNLIAPKDLIPEKKLGAVGMVSVESYASNITYPNQLVPRQYVRIQAATTVTVGDLPFDARMYVSTENSRSFPVNSFSFGFNAEQYRQNLEKQKQALQMKDARMREYFRNDLLRSQHQLDQYRAKLDQLKSSQNYNQWALDQLQAVPDIPGDSLLKARAYASLDSAWAAQKTALGDSAQAYSMDTANLRRRVEQGQKAIEKLEFLIDALDDKSFHLEKWVKQDSIRQVLTQQASDSIASGKKRAGEAKRFVEQVKAFQVGLFNPIFSEITLKGPAIKGAGITWQGNRFFVKAAAGKMQAITTAVPVSRDQNQAFSRLAAAVKAGWGNLDSTHIYAAVFHFRDTDDPYLVSGTWVRPLTNTVLSAGGVYRIYRGLQLSAEASTSGLQYQDQQHIVYTGSTGLPLANKGFHNAALQGAAKWQVNKMTGLQLTVKRIGTGYSSLGVPFIRNDYVEYQAKYQQKLFDKTVSAEAFYKVNRDNLSGSKGMQSTLRGFGLQVRTQWKKYPNLMVSYTPFEMNSTFDPQAAFVQAPLPSYRNRLAILMVNVNYVFRIKGSQWMTNLSGIRNGIQQNDARPVVQTSYNFTVQGTLPNSNRVSLSALHLIQEPVTDSSRMTMIEGAYGFNYRGTMIDMGAIHSNRDGVASKTGGFVQCSRKIWVLTARMRFNAFALAGNWPISQRREYSGSLGLGYSW